MVAQEQLRDAITKLTSLREEQSKKLDSISATVRINKAAGASTQSLHTLLKKSLMMRKQIASTEQRSRLIEQQVEVFENTEFNKSIVESLRTSADAMKNMGLQRAVDDVDGVMDEIHETFGLANEMQSTLSSSMPYNESHDTDDELMRELELITSGREQPTISQVPRVVNGIATNDSSAVVEVANIEPAYISHVADLGESLEVAPTEHNSESAPVEQCEGSETNQLDTVN
jgi:hypothetical protein